MVSWAEWEQEAAGLAQAGRRLLYQHGPGLGYVATVRADGAPRVHPVCPHIAEGRLWVFVGHASPKRFDLLREPRYALHAFPCHDVDDEFCIAGTAIPLADDAAEARVRAGLPFNSEPDDRPFELTIDRAMLATYGPRPSWPPDYTRWSVSRGPTPS
jgi:Pyridoxamine 5'-phosphate oxidase